MATIGTAYANSSAAPGQWCDIGTAAFTSNVTLSASAVTGHLVILPTSGEGSTFNPLLPIAVQCPAGGSIQGSTNSGLPASVGVGSVVCATASPSTVTINFINCGAASSVTAGTRLVLQQITGV